MASFTVAVIDLGSNSFRMQVSEVIEGAYKVVEEYKEVVRIGDIVYGTGGFTREAVQIILSTLRRMRIIMENMRVTRVRAVGTAPFRDASNTEEVLETIKNETGIEIEVITGDEEARLIYLAATGYFDLSDLEALFVDVGGGSTEFSFVENGELASSTSTPLGCSRLTQTFIHKQKAKPDEIKKLKKEIEKTLKHAGLPKDLDKLVFTGGTVNALAQIYVRRSALSDSSVKFVDTTFLNHLVNELAGKNYEARGKISGLEPERADISLAAALIVQSLLQKYDLNGFFAFSGGLRNGLTIDLLNRMGMTLLFQDKDDIRYSRLIETGRKYNFEEEHALHVTKLCHKLFLGVFRQMKLNESDWQLLEAASILHDIGQHIAYSEHHKHSYYLIKNTELVGYTDSEKDIIANIAKYHRRSTPKNDHASYHKLPGDDRERVYKLAAVLRIADGLDRSHVSAVEDFSVKITDKQVILALTAGRDISMEIEGVGKKKDMFEKVTGKELTVI